MTAFFFYKAEGGVTGVGLLQLVPAKEGPFLLLAEVRSLLQEPVGDPALTDPWRGEQGRDLYGQEAGQLSLVATRCRLGRARRTPTLTRHLSDHGLRDPPVRQEALDLLFDHSTVPPTSRGGEGSTVLPRKVLSDITHSERSKHTHTFMAAAAEAEYMQESGAQTLL